MLTLWDTLAARGRGRQFLELLPIGMRQLPADSVVGAECLLIFQAMEAFLQRLPHASPRQTQAIMHAAIVQCTSHFLGK